MNLAATRFVSNVELWDEIQRRVRTAKRVLAAVAYFGDSGAEILPLRRGSRLVVNMSLNTVRQGATDPHEIGKLLERGVQVFSRDRLHAKFIIADGTLIVSSANISQNARRVLDEAGTITQDPSALRAAVDLFEKFCTEPVRPGYLKECIAAYQPPHFKPGAPLPAQEAEERQRIVQAKLWFIWLGKRITPSEEDATTIDKLKERATKNLRRPDRTHVENIRHAMNPKFLNYPHVGDWIVDCGMDGGSRYVRAPAQVIGEEILTSRRGKKSLLFLLERLDVEETMPFAEFRGRIATVEPSLDRDKPRSRAIEDRAHADAILQLWTHAGRIRRAE